MVIIPAIDVIDGKCVRLSQGRYSAKIVYDESPVEVALRFQDVGCTRLHLVDLDGAKAKRIVNYRILERIAAQCPALRIDFGGGVQSDDDARIAFECGARQITVGSLAVKDRPTFLRWLETFGAEAIILAADARDEKIAVAGWEETTELSLVQFLADYRREGVQYALCTDISKDGMMQGSANDLYRRLRDEIPELRLIASGGISSIGDIEELDSIGMWGAVIGKALYEGALSLQDLQRFL
jgi:phosphoribosylformimino-5-aminoimidazole carboxamide ribotide isomerase